MIGREFNRLIVIFETDEIDSRGQRMTNYVCACECGGFTVTSGQSLRESTTLSCGCLRREIAVEKINRCHVEQGKEIHGRTRTLTYQTWRAMEKRCLNEWVREYPNYGGRGIKVCERWLHSFTAFLEDMGERPAKEFTLDRIDNNGDYEPGNCRWATKKQQARNRRSAALLTLSNETRSIVEWVERLGISRSALAFRIRAGWDIENIVNTPMRSRKA